MPLEHGPKNRIKGWKPVQKIAVADAVLCVDCDFITEARNDHCLACGSHSMIHIERLLAGPESPTPNPQSLPEAP